MLNYSNFNIESMKVCNLNTGEELMNIDVPKLSQEIFSTNEKPKYFLGGSASFEADTNYINNDLMRELFGINKRQPTNYKTQFDTSIYKKQIRTHKKKRINKKWANRYGYRDVVGTYEADVDFGEFNKLTSEVNCEFTNLHLIKIDGNVLK
jgi:hypothetical protein